MSKWKRKQYKRRNIKAKRRYISSFKGDKYPSARITRLYKKGWI